MICSNMKCGKEIATPLECFDGKWYCPHCFEEVQSGNVRFRIDRESNDKYELSQVYFCQWLTTQNADTELLDKAVAYCKEAAFAGHPKAILRLGYFYDKDYIEKNNSEKARVVIAEKYYSSLCDNPNEKIEGGYDAHVDLDEVKAQAAQYRKTMLDAVKKNEKARQSGADDRVSEFILACSGKERPPLFGLFGVKLGELLPAFGNTAESLDNSVAYRAAISGRVRILYFERGGKRRGLSNKDPIENNLFARDKDEEVLLLIYNNKSQSMLGKKNVTFIGDVLEKGDLLHDFVSKLKSPEEIIAHQDDVFYFCKGRSPGKGAIAEMTETMYKKIVEGETE